ncbi:hypothetical protein ISN35_14220 [Xanthomonas translucens pv. undulosa]|uniref:hypothetical protein n=1 Tax=Xanthomonas campestris pv. translucens TaxID=343 RepID=UPI0006426C8B|nr:hypothetical protein [Xanthomonas translucens]AKK67564.1 hypothetical protein FD63_08790 [Xanthomonas translucens pv. undulosa]MCT8272690.1 hypothetical protein [Xanthomonas translucens pv. undulosa]QEO26311.1 hypothetical protein F0H32_08995 [Xanthomonas translucens pv. undulosa]QSQ40601.1 hypothetical protein ISN33_13215 [Xanthomonas translucens pv. translucens]QSQ48203.1 hypothetical protein ISN35_14220 [Xanthomonas translucens pv. undulosa]
MLQLTPEQYAKLCLPDPGAFLPRLAAEVRRDYPKQVAKHDDVALLALVRSSYDHAVHVLHITHLPTLVRWVKADVAWAPGLRNQAITGVWFAETDNPNVTAADLLSMLSSDLGQ